MFKYYSPDLKRFMNRDVIVGTIEQSQTLNRYAFVNGNPISYHDPFGLARSMLQNVSGSLFTMGAVHMGLDIAGMVPLFGMIPDALNTGLYLVKGDFVNATMSSMAIVPGPGDALTAGKLAMKYGDEVVGGAKLVGKYGDDVAGVAGKGYTKVSRSGGSLKMDLQMFGSKGNSKRPGGYIQGDVDAHGYLSPGINRAKGHTGSKFDNRIQSHHPIQNEWAKRWANDGSFAYSETKAPAVLLPSSSGQSHAKISSVQRRRRRVDNYNTDIRYEFNEGYNELITAGVNQKTARKSIKKAYKYFDSLGGFSK